MIFSEDELDTSVEKVRADAINDIAKMNQDISTVNSQKLSIREMTKKRLLEKEDVLKNNPIDVDLKNEPLDVTVKPSVYKDDQLELNFEPTIEKETFDKVSVQLELGNSENDKVIVDAVIEKDEKLNISVQPNFAEDEFVAKENGNNISDLVNEGLAQDTVNTNVSATVEQDKNFSDLSIEKTKIVNESVSDASSIDFTKIVNLKDDTQKSPEIKVDIKNSTDIEKVEAEVYKDEDLNIKVSAKLKNDRVVVEDVNAEVYKDESIDLGYKAKLKNEKTTVEKVTPELYEDEDISVEPNPESYADNNFADGAKITTEMYDKNLFEMTTSYVSPNQIKRIASPNLRSKKLSLSNDFELEDMSDELPFSELPPDFVKNAMGNSTDGNFAETLGPKAKEVIMNTLSEFTTNLISEVFKEADQNFLSFSVETVLKNCLDNIQNADGITQAYLDREFKLSTDEVASLQNKVKSSIKADWEGETNAPVKVSWDNYDAMLETAADLLYQQVNNSNQSIKDTLNSALDSWKTILSSMLTDTSRPTATLGRNPSIDALIGSGPDAYKNMYDIILVQHDGTSINDDIKHSTTKPDEMIVDLIGSSFLAVRTGGITIPEIKSKTVDIPYLWGNVTKVVPQNEMNKKLTLTIEADQYLFLYDSLLKVSGKYLASSKYGLIEPTVSADSTNYVPVQLGTICSKSWTDVKFKTSLNTKPRVDLLVKIRNLSPLLMDTGNVAAGLEPYFVFEDVRFLGNGSLQFGRTDVSKVTFDTDLIFRRMYKVNINSHSNTNEKSTLVYLGDRDYTKSPDQLIINNQKLQTSVGPSGSKVVEQVPAGTVDSSTTFGSELTKNKSTIDSNISSATKLGDASMKQSKSNMKTGLGASKSSKDFDADALVTAALERYVDSLKDVQGDMTVRYSESDVKIVGGQIVESKMTTKEFSKQNIEGNSSMSSDAITEIGTQARSANGSTPGMDTSKVSSGLKSSISGL